MITDEMMIAASIALRQRLDPELELSNGLADAMPFRFVEAAQYALTAAYPLIRAQVIAECAHFLETLAREMTTGDPCDWGTLRGVTSRQTYSCAQALRALATNTSTSQGNNAVTQAAGGGSTTEGETRNDN